MFAEINHLHNHRSDPRSTSFRSSVLRDKKQFEENLDHELALREINSVVLNLREKKRKVIQCLETERRMIALSERLSYFEAGREKALFNRQECLMDSLHVQMRVAEKLVWCVLAHGLSTAAVQMEGNTVTQRQEAYVNNITNYVRTSVLGTPTHPYEWKFPCSDGRNGNTLYEISAVSLNKRQARLFVAALDNLIDLSYTDDEGLRDTLKESIGNYRAAMDILLLHRNYKEEEIIEFQDRVDCWWRVWANVFGLDACTNYTHMLSSGHVQEEMGEWKCHHRYSQEGLEAVNALIKSYYFRRSTRRGGTGRDRFNRLLAVGRWLQRKVWWMITATKEREIPDDMSESESMADTESGDDGDYTDDDGDRDDEEYYDYYDTSGAEIDCHTVLPAGEGGVINDVNKKMDGNFLADLFADSEDWASGAMSLSDLNQTETTPPTDREYLL